MDHDMVRLDFFHSEDFHFVRLVRRGAKDDFVMGSPVHGVLQYNSVTAGSWYECRQSNIDHLLQVQKEKKIHYTDSSS